MRIEKDPNFVDVEEEEKRQPAEVWKGDPKRLKPDEELVYDNKAYEIFYRTSVEWPCLSLDLVHGPDKGLDFPYSINAVAGSQSSTGKNCIYYLQFTEMYKTQHDDESGSESDSDQEDLDGGDPVLESYTTPHSGSVNRIRICEPRQVVATWSETGCVNFWDVSKVFNKMFNENWAELPKNENQLLLNRFQYREEGFGLEWGKSGWLLAGNDVLHVYAPRESGWVEHQTYSGHTDAIEDIKHSPVEESVYATCSVDQSIKLWDLRVAQDDAQITLPNCHTSDINVISWNAQQTSWIASGSDDGSFKVWDLRTQQHAANISWHSDAITSIAWNPTDAFELAVSSADDIISVWNFSITEGESEEGQPDQLLFVHHNQEDIKEISYHDKYEMIVSTAGNGFNLFKPAINEAVES